MQFCIKVVVLNRSYSTNPQPRRESQICSYYNFFYFAFLIDIIDNIITYSPYSPYYIIKSSANGSAVYWSHDFRLYHVTMILHC